MQLAAAAAVHGDAHEARALVGAAPAQVHPVLKVPAAGPHAQQVFPGGGGHVGVAADVDGQDRSVEIGGDNQVVGEDVVDGLHATEVHIELGGIIGEGEPGLTQVAIVAVGAGHGGGVLVQDDSGDAGREVAALGWGGRP